jgi:hypothetical protein
MSKSSLRRVVFAKDVAIIPRKLMLERLRKIRRTRSHREEL